MRHHHHRQQPSGAITYTGLPSALPNGSLQVDSSPLGGTGPTPPPPTLTVLTTAPPTTTTTLPASVSSTPSSSSSTSNFSTGAMIGLIVGIFAVLAVALVVFMSIRHKKRRQSGRDRAKSFRKSWSRLNDDRKPTELQMRATGHANSPSIADSNNRSFSSSHPLVTQSQAVLPSQNPSLTQASSGSGQMRGVAVAPPSISADVSHVPPSSRSADESHIPNPFTSPRASPSHSPTPSHTSTYSSHAHSLGPAALSSFTPHMPQYAHASIITASSASDYPLEFPTPPDHVSVAEKAVKDEKPSASQASNRLSRKQSAKIADETRSRELKAMQDLISALDERANQKAPPSAVALRVDTDSSHGTSRLSMGEGLVTPGGRSIREEDAM